MEAPICTSEDIRFDKEHVRDLIKKFIEDGVDAVQILADFDRTLTKEKIDEKMCSTCFIAIRKSPFVTSTYTEKSRENYECYRPIEMMPTCEPDDQEVSEGKITLEDKLKCMEEWWDKDLGALSKEGLSHESFQTIAKTCDIYFRNGISHLLSTKKELEIPMLVVSAGIGELIKASFETISEENGYSYEDLKPFNLVSNLGVYEDNILVKFNKPYVHIMNKAGHVKKFIDLQKQLDEESHHHLRGNIIVMGDVIEDLKMIAEISYDNIIKVGYLNNLTQDSHLIEEYEKVFDIVILNDGNLWPIISIVDVVAGRKISCKDKLTPEFLSFIEEFE